jgi:dolichol-phosphate mannosyltransferase
MTNHTACVLIATYNEAESIGQILYYLTNSVGIDVFLVDDNSPDGTANIARGFPLTNVIVRTTKRGIASAYLDGFKHILENHNYGYIIQMDAGLTHDPTDIARMLNMIEYTNSDLVLSTRQINIQKIKSFRTVLSKSARLLMKFIGVNQTDVTSGFRCWKTDLLKKIDFDKITAKGFGFQLQLLYYATKLKAKISEHPVQYVLTNSTINSKIIFESAKIWLQLFYLNLFSKNS